MAQGSHGLIYDFGPFRLDVQRRSLHCRDIKVPLRPKMYSLLLLLLSRAGHIVSKDDIADALWPGGYVLEGNITQQIFFLREALREHDDTQEYVVTNPGIGYTFTVPVGKLRKSDRARAHPEAYLEYIKGLNSVELRTEEGYQAATSHFRTSIDRYPDFEPAHAALANVLSRLATMDGLYPHEAFPRAKEAALRALELDPQSPEAVATLGQIAQYYERDERTAYGLLVQAIELNPRASSLRIFMAWHFFLFGHLERAREQLDYVLAAEPDAARAHFSLAMVCLFAEDFELAVAMLRTVKEVSPAQYLPQFYLGTILAEMGDANEALRVFAELPATFLPRFTRAAVAHAHAVAGNVSEARSILQELETRSKTCYISHYYLARAYSALRDDGMLHSALLKAEKDADPWLVFLRAHPFWKRHRSDRLIARLMQPRVAAASS